MSDTEDKGFTVKDRRYFAQTEAEQARMREEEKQAEAAYEAASGPEEQARQSASGAAGAVPLPEINFITFLMSLSSSAFMHLGDIPDPNTGEKAKDLPLAKQTIDLLALLRQKTQNNLDQDEERLFDHLLYELRMRYIKEAAPA